jgi:hypothetical protein
LIDFFFFPVWLLVCCVLCAVCGLVLRAVVCGVGWIGTPTPPLSAFPSPRTQPINQKQNTSNHPNKTIQTNTLKHTTQPWKVAKIAKVATSQFQVGENKSTVVLHFWIIAYHSSSSFSHPLLLSGSSSLWLSLSGSRSLALALWLSLSGSRSLAPPLARFLTYHTTPNEEEQGRSHLFFSFFFFLSKGPVISSFGAKEQTTHIHTETSFFQSQNPRKKKKKGALKPSNENENKSKGTVHLKPQSFNAAPLFGF